MLRIISETKPAWVIGENVFGIINMELEQVCLDLEAEGYEVQPIIIPACAVNAPHRRDRVWIIAKLQRQALNEKQTTGIEQCAENASNTTGTGLEGENWYKSEHSQCPRYSRNGQWNENWYEIAAEFCRVDARIPLELDFIGGLNEQEKEKKQRTNRLKSLGNSIVPQVVMEIMYAIKNLGNNYEED